MFKKGKVELGLDLLGLVHKTVRQENFEENIRKIADLGISFIRIFNCDRDDMRFKHYNQAYWLRLEKVLILLKKYKIIPIISLCGYYRINQNRISFEDRKTIFQKTHEIAKKVCKKKILYEAANEPKYAPKDFFYKSKKIGMSGQMERLGVWHEWVSDYFHSLGFPRKQIIGNCIDDPAYPKVASTGDMIPWGLSKRETLPMQDVITSWHNIFFFEDIKSEKGAGRIYIARRLWKYIIGTDGGSASGKVGHGIGVGCPERKFGINIDNKELENLIEKTCELTKAGIQGYRISIWFSDLPREYFCYTKTCKLYFDLNSLDFDRIKGMAEAYKKIYKKYPKNYNKFPEIKPIPEPEPEPKPPEPINPIKEKIMRKKLNEAWWKLLRFHFGGFWDHAIWEQKWSAISIPIVFMFFM